MSRAAPTFAEPAAAAPQGRPGRLVFVDLLRTVIIAWVIVHHAAQAYGPTGGTWVVHDRAHSDWFQPLYTVDAAVGLGLLFLLAGYFVPAACDRKGPGRYFRERWVRIGVPLVAFVLAVNLPLVYVVKGRPAPGEFIHELYDGGWQLIYLHLWFLGHLLLYSGIYVAWRLAAGRAGRPRRTWAPPGHAAIAGFVVALALLTWIVRLWYPVDKWVPLAYVLAAEPAKMPQYISLFAVGVMAYRGDWLRRMPTRAGMIWLGAGLLAAAGIFVLQALGQWNLIGGGGLNWPSLVRSTWEAVICAGLSVGLIVLFREMFHRPRRLLAAMAAASYAAYIIHIYIIVGLQAGIEGVNLPAVVKFALVAVAGIILAFGIGHLSRKVPGLRVVLGTTPRQRDKTAAPA